MTDQVPEAPRGTEVIDLADRRPPVCYTVHLTDHWNGTLELMVDDVSDDERSRLAVADALERAAEMLRHPKVRTERVR